MLGVDKHPGTRVCEKCHSKFAPLVYAFLKSREFPETSGTAIRYQWDVTTQAYPIIARFG